MVGYTLRQERERQELSIDDIEQGTSIRAVYIEAIENGEYDELPGAVYTKGFIKNYAKFLGLDADSVVKEFTNDMAELAAEKEAANAQNPDANSEQQTSEKVIELKPIQREKKPLGHSIGEKNHSSSGLLIVAAVVFIAAIAGLAWSWLSATGDVAKVDPPPTPQPVVTEPAPTETPAPVAENPQPEPQSTGINIQARFNNRCWTLVTVDDTVVQEGIIEGGQTLSWEGKDKITFRLGNAGAVEFFQDGKSLGVPGAEGDIADKVFTRQ